MDRVVPFTLKSFGFVRFAIRNYSSLGPTSVLHDRNSFLKHFDDLENSATITARPKLWKPEDGPRELHKRGITGNYLPKVRIF